MDFLHQISNNSTYFEHKQVLTTALNQENTYREIYANPSIDINNPCLTDNHCDLINVFENLNCFKYRERFIEEESGNLFPLENKGIVGKPCVNEKSSFRSNFNLLSEGMFDDFDWSNVVVAGGSVSAALLPIPEKYSTKKERRKYFHDDKYGGTDVDLFFYGLDEEAAKAKIATIASTIEGNSLFPVRYVRTSHSITIVNQYPFVNIQIILRLYKTSAEVIMGFDIDSCALCYDGENVYCLPRSYHALVSQYNTIDMTRRSPTYESRLAKYAERGYEVLYPELHRDKIDPLIFEKPFEKLHGLDRLLVLEKFNNPNDRYDYLIRKTMSRGHPLSSNMEKIFQNPRMKNNLYGEKISDYSAVFFPWGPQWTAKKVVQLLELKDFLINSDWFENDDGNKERKNYHTHPCFVGIHVQDVFGDHCGCCPPYPEEEKINLEDKYVQGELHFIVDNPGRQFIGSFHPITDGDWTEGSYINEKTGSLMACCNQSNKDLLIQFFAENSDFNINQQDVLGRTGLLINAFSGNCDILSVLLEKQVNVRLSLKDGRSAFHIACCYNHPSYLKQLLEYNSHLLPQDENPQIRQYDITNRDTHFLLAPIEYAILFGNEACVSLLLDYGSPVTMMKSQETQNSIVFHLITTVKYYPEAAEKILQLFIQKGFNCTAFFLNTIQSPDLCRLFLKLEPKCKQLINCFSNYSQLPIINPIQNCDLETFKLFIDNGAKMTLNKNDIQVINEYSMKLPGQSHYSYTAEHIQMPLVSLIQQLNIYQIEEKRFNTLKEMLQYAQTKNLVDFATLNEPIITQFISTIYNANAQKEAAQNQQLAEKRKSCKKRGAQASSFQFGNTFGNPFGNPFGGAQNNIISDSNLELLKNAPKDSYLYFLSETFQKYIDYVDESNKKLQESQKQNTPPPVHPNVVYVNGCDYVMQLMKDNLVWNQEVYDKYGVGGLTNVLSAPGKQDAQLSYTLITETRNYGYNNTTINEAQIDEYTQLFEAVWKKDYSKLTELTSIEKEHHVFITCCDIFGFTPLSLAIYVGDMKMIQLVLQISLEQYTPYSTVEVKNQSSHRFNNFDFIAAPMSAFSSAPVVTKQIDVHQDVNSIVSLTSPLFLIQFAHALQLIDKLVPLSNPVRPLDGMNQYLFPENAIELAVTVMKPAEFDQFLTSVFEVCRGALRKQNIAEETIKESITFSSLQPAQRCYYTQNAHDTIQFGMINGLEMTKFLIEHCGACYQIPYPSNDPNNYYPGRQILHLGCVAISLQQLDILKFLLSEEAKQLFISYQEKYNLEKNLWEKYTVLDKVCEQFSSTYNATLIEKACVHNSPEILKYLLSLKLETPDDQKTKVIYICLTQKYYDCLQLLLQNGYTLLELPHFVTIYQQSLEKNEFIISALAAYTKESIIEIYTKDTDFQLLYQAALRGFASLTHLLNSGYKLSQHNIFYQSICQYILTNIGEEETVVGLIERYEKENLSDLLFGQEDVSGDILYDSYLTSFLNRQDKNSVKIGNIITNETLNHERKLINEDVVRNTSHEQEKQQIGEFGRGRGLGRGRRGMPREDEDYDDEDDGESDNIQRFMTMNNPAVSFSFVTTWN